MKQIIFSFLIFFFLNSCVYDSVSVFRINNTTSNTYYLHLSCADSLNKDMKPILNDTIYREDGGVQNIFYHYIGAKNKEAIVGNFHNFKSKIFPCNKGKLYLFFIKDSIVYSHHWDSIVKYQLYDKKIGLTEKELKQKKWRIRIE